MKKKITFKLLGYVFVFILFYLMFLISFYLFSVLLIANYETELGLNENRVFVLGFFLDLFITSMFILIGVYIYRFTKNKAAFWIIYSIISILICLFALKRGLVLGGI